MGRDTIDKYYSLLNWIVEYPHHCIDYAKSCNFDKNLIPDSVLNTIATNDLTSFWFARGCNYDENIIPLHILSRAKIYAEQNRYVDPDAANCKWNKQ